MGTPTSVALTGAAGVSSPVYDSVSGCVFVGDTNGYLFSVNSGTPGSACTLSSFTLNQRSELLGNGLANEGIFDAPNIDSSAGTVYVFVADSAAIQHAANADYSHSNKNFTLTSGTLTTADVGRTIAAVGIGSTNPYTTNTIATVTSATGGTLTNTPNGSGFGTSATITEVAAGSAAVDEFSISQLSGGVSAAPAQAEPLGTGAAGYPIYDGNFDDAYFSNGTGNVWAVGGTGTNASAASLYNVPASSTAINAYTPAGITGASVARATVTSGNEYPWPSPLSEFDDGTNDYAFFSVNRGATALGCTGAAGTGCILSFTLSGTTATQSGTGQNYVTPATNGCWATGGIVIDNSDSANGGAQIYFANFNGQAAGSISSSNTVTPTSSNCTTGATATLQGVQAEQSNP